MMVLSNTIVSVAIASIVALNAQAAPLEKRIAQVITDSTTLWVQACTAAGGGQQCNPISVTAFSTLLAGAGDCDQQNAADSMIDLAKTLNNDPKMIALAQVFAQQPRNSPNSLSVNYCQQPPKNAELNGLFQCQFQGVNSQLFTGNVKVGAKGTIPLGLNAPLSPSGSCKAHPQGPIPGGTQLTAITQDPGVGNTVGSGSSNSNSTTPTSNPASTVSPNAPANSGTSSNSGDTTFPPQTINGSTPSPTGGVVTVVQTVTVTVTATGTPTMSAGSATSPAQASPSTTAGFQAQNGKAAQALNAKFASLTASSSCNEGDQACINGGFAQCVGGKFTITQCAGGTQCFALPLVNKAGTSIACTTQADAASRIQASGATGGITGQ